MLANPITTHDNLLGYYRSGKAETTLGLLLMLLPIVAVEVILFLFHWLLRLLLLLS